VDVVSQNAALDPRARRLAGALTTGVVVAAWEAMPDLVSSRRGVVGARSAVAAAALPVLVAVAPRRSLAFGNAADTEHDRHRELAESASALADPRLAALAAAGVITVIVVQTLAESRGKRAVVRGLAARGVPRPRAALGVGLGVLAAVATYLDETKRG
jgi:hypothetical protein